MPPGCFPYADRATVLYTSAGNSLELRRPDFGDKEEILKNRIIRTTRRNTLKHYRKSTWPRRRRVTYPFSNLPDSDFEAVLEFLRITNGCSMSLLDYNSRTWGGIITNPETAVSNNGRLCQVSVTIIFEGIVVKPSTSPLGT
jgi:hypothetical protein